MNIDILGKGISFPLKVNPRGEIEKARGEEKIRQSILIILGTQHGERKMRPDFGCNLKSLLFAPNNTTTANLARFYVEEGLKKWEPRIRLEHVVIENDNREGRLVIEVHYRIKSTNESNNLVYPFYLQQP
jgi:phage baseplate assembly protein W